MNDSWLASSRFALFVVHIAAMVPLSMSLASWTHSGGNGKKARLLVGLGVVGLLLAAAVVILPVAGHFRFFARTLMFSLCVCVAESLCFWLVPAVVLSSHAKGSRLWWIACLAVALVAPSSFRGFLAEQQQRLAEKYWSEGRLLRYLELADESADQVMLERKEQARTLVLRHRAVTSQPLPANATRGERFLYARMLASLDEFHRAEVILTANKPTAQEAAFLGAILQQQRRFKESNDWYESSLQTKSNEPSSMAHVVRATNAIAFNLRELGQFSQAEQKYLDSLERYPEAAYQWHLHLGQHYVLGGRFWEAQQHLHVATQGPSAENTAEAKRILADLRQQTPACLLPLGPLHATQR